MNIVLDMDGTLISEPRSIYVRIKPRPFLSEFLKYCFESFDSVSIWTAASWKHFNEINKTIFKPILDELNVKWRVVYTQERCTVKRNIRNPEYFHMYPYVVKRLRKIWKLSGHTRHNTLIVDDKPITYSDNWGNAIPIETYIGWAKDDNLERLIGFLDELREVYERCGTIRHTEKRFWKK